MDLGDHFARARKIPKSSTCAWTHSVLTSTGPKERADAAQLVAHLLMGRLMEGSPNLFSSWQVRASLGTKKQTDSRKTAQISAFIQLVFGLPGSPLPDDHAQGTVAEILWWFSMSTVDFPSAAVVKIFGPDVRVTSPGGDGLVFHRDTATGALFFRLWESKKHTQSGGISSTISTAQNQLSDRAARYLAQYTALAVVEPDSGIQRLLASLVEHWIDASAQASAGFSVTTSYSPKRAFSGAPKKFPKLARKFGLEGLVTTVPDYPGFVDEVRRIVWNGL